jgi:hypothetical protein
VRAARPEGARDDAARRWLRPVKQSQASASSAIAAAHVPTSAAAPSSSPPSATAAAPAAAAKAARGAAKATRPVGKAARAAAKEARWVLLSSALAQRGAPKVGERVQGKYQVRHDIRMQDSFHLGIRVEAAQNLISFPLRGLDLNLAVQV